MFSNFNHGLCKINESIFIGGYQSAQDPEILKQHRITRVLNVSPQDYEKEYKKELIYFFDISYLYLPFENNPSHLLHKALHFIHSAKKEKMLIHCQHGLSQSVSVVMAWLIKYQGFSYNQALDLIKKQRPLAVPYSGLQEQLRALDSNKNFHVIASRSMSLHELLLDNDAVNF